MAQIKNAISKKTITSIFSVALMLITIVVLLGYIVPSYKNARTIGMGIGDKTGKMVGDLIGSSDGIKEGLAKGGAEGKEAGLSAKDTTSEIKNRFRTVGNLEVLNAGINLKDVNKIGEDYAVLYTMKAIALFTVNLQDVDIKNPKAESIEILLPDIGVDIYIDEKSTEKLAEYQKHTWSGSSEDGFMQFMNSRDAIDESVRDRIDGYEALRKAAEDSAKKQVESIARAATGNEKSVTVEFKREVHAND